MTFQTAFKDFYFKPIEFEGVETQISAFCTPKILQITH